MKAAASHQQSTHLLLTAEQTDWTHTSTVVCITTTGSGHGEIHCKDRQRRLTGLRGRGILGLLETLPCGQDPHADDTGCSKFKDEQQQKTRGDFKWFGLFLLLFILFINSSQVIGMGIGKGTGFFVIALQVTTKLDRMPSPQVQKIAINMKVLEQEVKATQ